MPIELGLTPQQQAQQASFRAFVDKVVVPEASRCDQEEYTPMELIQKIAEQGYLGAIAPVEYGGLAMDMLTLGLLHEEFGRGCSSLRSLLTVQSMVIYALTRWGNTWQREKWLPKLIRGEMIAAFALSEAEAGSDASQIETIAVQEKDGHYSIQGQKKWVTYGQIAHLILLFAYAHNKITAFLVESETPGISAKPIKGVLGTRGSMLAVLSFNKCRVSSEHKLGGREFGLASVATSALDIGRYSVACGCVGMAQACLDASLHYASKRQQFGKYIKDHQLIQQMLTDMIVSIKAARLLCRQAGYLKDLNDPRTIMETWIAKYFASTTAVKAANFAVQIHGANGCSADYPVQRYYRDAKIMEIIEGSTQIQQITIASYGGGE
ncbi:MAG TPA: acyl-CoA dehydrogenase family protein [Ktedonobacteraceae bacterium]|nr:acyl-CoA dehydrogenase family protein [Ktedonobacteraceae bacterium]